MVCEHGIVFGGRFPPVDVAKLRNDVRRDAGSVRLFGRPSDDRSIEIETVDRETISSRGHQSLGEPNLQITGAGADADKTTHSRRWAVPRRELLPLGGQRS